MEPFRAWLEFDLGKEVVDREVALFKSGGNNQKLRISVEQNRFSNLVS